MQCTFLNLMALIMTSTSNIAMLMIKFVNHKISHFTLPAIYSSTAAAIKLQKHKFRHHLKDGCMLVSLTRL